MYLYSVELGRYGWKTGAYTFVSCYLSRFQSAISYFL